MMKGNTLNMATKHKSKKWLLNLDTDCTSENQYAPMLSTEDWPKCIIIQCMSSDTPITKRSPLAIHKGFTGIVGAVKDVEKLRSGQILVECSKK